MREGDLMHDYGGNGANGRVGADVNTEVQVLWVEGRATLVMANALAS